MPLLTSLLILIIIALLFGQLFRRFNQPAIVGEMLAGILLGPSVLNVITVNAGLTAISDLAVFFVVLSAGLETNFNNIKTALFGKGILIAILGFIIPFIMGLVIGYAYHLTTTSTVFIALCISITALPVAVRILQSFKMLHSEIASYAIATSIFNDVVALMILGVLLNLPDQASYRVISAGVLLTGSKFMVLAALILCFNWLIQRMVAKKVRFEHVQKKFVDFVGNVAIFGILVLFVLAFGAVSEALGFHFVIGTFFGALLIDKKLFLASHYQKFERSLNDLMQGFLAPVFFAFLGLKFNLLSMPSFSFVLVVLLVSVISKMFAGWFGGCLIRLPRVNALGIGIILNARGIMELVIASIGYQHGLIDQGLFSTFVLMGVFTTLITPLMFRQWVMPSVKKPH